MSRRSLLAVLLLTVEGLQTVAAQGFRVHKSDGTVAQFSMRTDSIVFYDGIGSDADFGPFTPVNDLVAGKWYRTKSEWITFNPDGTTTGWDNAWGQGQQGDFIYRFFPYQGNIVVYERTTDVPLFFLRVVDVSRGRLVIVDTNGQAEMLRVMTHTQPVQPVTYIGLNNTSLTLESNCTAQLSANVFPEDADNKEVVWESSNESVATVNADGLVTATDEGDCSITCRATDGSNVYATCWVTVCDIDDKDREQPLPLTITVSETPLLNTDGSASAPATRAAVTTTSTLTAFTLDYQYMYSNDLQYGQQNATKNGEGKWVTDGFWPDDAWDNIEVSWYAHTDGTMVNQENPYIYFSVEELASEQNDLLVATATGTRTSTGGHLAFTFDHACTALKFYVKKATNLNDYTLTLTSIQLCNVVSQGDYYFTDKSWTLGKTRSDYTLYSGGSDNLSLGSEDYTLLNANEDDFLFMIPQVLTPWDATTAINDATSQTYIKIECSLRKEGTTPYDGTAYIPFGATLQAGYKHDVKINIGKNSLYSGANTKIIQ